MLCRQNSNASMYQKLLFIAMRTFCARASDISGVSWQNFSVERSYTDAKGILTRFPRSLTSVDFFEKKNGASKPIMLLPFNNDDALCIYVALGDNAMGGTFNLPCKANTDFETFLFPTIAGKGDGAAAAIISKSLKFFAPHIHSALDHDKTITDLPKDISSHGIRRAVIDEAGFAGASNPAVCAVSGHALSNITLDLYFGKRAVKSVPVGRLMAGYSLPPNSVHSYTPVPPDLSCLSTALWYKNLPELLNQIFQIMPTVTPLLAVGGAQRYFVHDLLAAQFMYFERRRVRYGSQFLPVARLLVCLQQFCGCATPAIADNLACAAGAVILEKFLSDNHRIINEGHEMEVLQHTVSTSI